MCRMKGNGAEGKVEAEEEDGNGRGSPAAPNGDTVSTAGKAFALRKEHRTKGGSRGGGGSRLKQRASCVVLSNAECSDILFE